MVGCLTFSGEYFMHIQDNNKLKKNLKIYRNEGEMRQSLQRFDWYWKNMESWVEKKLALCSSY